MLFIAGRNGDEEEERKLLAKGVQSIQNNEEREEGLAILLRAWSKRSKRHDTTIDTEALFWTGWALRRHGLTDELSRVRAANFMKRALLQTPTHGVARFYYGDSLIDIGQIHRGIYEIRRALKDEPDNFDASAKSKLLRAEALARLRISREESFYQNDLMPASSNLHSKAFIHLWDAVVGDPAALRSNTFKIIEYLAERRETSLWFPLGNRTPATAIEYAVVTSLQPLVESFLSNVSSSLKKRRSLLGVEIWARHQHVDKGVVSHYDFDISAQRHSANSVTADHLPAASSILFLSDYGGATFVLDHENNNSAFVFPRYNRFAIFEGTRLHGVLPVNIDSSCSSFPDNDDDEVKYPQTGARITLLINWWYHRPTLPQCASMPTNLFGYAHMAATSIPVKRVANDDPQRRRCISQLNLFDDDSNFGHDTFYHVPCPEDQFYHPAFFSSSSSVATI